MRETTRERQHEGKRLETMVCVREGTSEREKEGDSGRVRDERVCVRGVGVGPSERDN